VYSQCEQGSEKSQKNRTLEKTQERSGLFKPVDPLAITPDIMNADRTAIIESKMHRSAAAVLASTSFHR
jgi:hypothetical protein